MTLIFSPAGLLLGKHRKVMPTAVERRSELTLVALTITPMRRPRSRRL